MRPTAFFALSLAVLGLSAAHAEETAVAPSAQALDPMAAVKGEYLSDPGHAYITFSYLHQGYSRPTLRFDKWTGTLKWDPKKLEKSSIVVDIDAASVNSGVAKFDEHLVSADFFDVATHPKIAFKSTGLTRTGDATGTMTGDLTIKGVTQPVTLDVTLNRAADDDFAKGHKLGFSARGKLLRSAFGVDKYVPFVGDEIDVMIEAEFVKPRTK